MRIEYGLPATATGRPVALSVGNFDGVHLGHRALLEPLLAAAREIDGEAVVLTFDPHPRCVLTPEHCPSSLTTLEEKRDLLAVAGVDRLVVLEFTTQLSRWTADEFCSRLEAAFTLSRLVVGHDFALGRDRSGDTAFLTARAARRGWILQTVDAVRVEDRPVSSSRIRGALVTGDLIEANRLLGHPYFIDGRIEHGERVGTTLGYPTANISIAANKCLPARGIYAMWLRVDDAWQPAATSVGYRPTFGGDHLTVEAYLLDFSGDLYGRRVRGAFEARLREERTYPDGAALREQIRRDVEQTGLLLSASKPPSGI
ncbi:MAG: bifunctional riboflavin kinase/FAD synthetase [Candidatus Dormibacteria bacterium]